MAWTGQGRCRRVERAVGALVRAANLANAENVERSRVKRLYIEFFRPEWFDYHGLSGSRQVGHRKVSATFVYVKFIATTINLDKIYGIMAELI